MKKITLIISTLFFLTFLRAQTTWKADPNHSKLTFSTVHHGIADIAGLFKKFEITVVTNKMYLVMLNLNFQLMCTP